MWGGEGVAFQQSEGARHKRPPQKPVHDGNNQLISPLGQEKCSPGQQSLSQVEQSFPHAGDQSPQTPSLNIPHLWCWIDLWGERAPHTCQAFQWHPQPLPSWCQQLPLPQRGSLRMSWHYQMSPVIVSWTHSVNEHWASLCMCWALVFQQWIGTLSDGSPGRQASGHAFEWLSRFS